MQEKSGQSGQAAKRKTGLLYNQAGLGLIEVLVAAVIFAFVLLSFGYMYAVGQGMIGSNGDRRMAVTFAVETTEEIKGRGFDWLATELATAQAGQANTYTLTDTNGDQEWVGTDTTGSNFFQRQVAIAYVNDDDFQQIVTSSDSIRITVTVSPGGAGRYSEFSPVSMVTALTRF
ncbi:MAG: prepilin-type N-terminal cleavage/methylation domain-containing protein [Candidatus Schekmanbacteria bacterium]|nr:prepilin-type N-terminal cleavage/methylation domain-containing protein [Candidatus Schekmanbacteria bacterium]